MTSDRPRWAPLMEGLVLIGLIAAMNAVAFRGDPGFVRVAPHPTLFITLLIAVRYGLYPGLLIATISSVVYSVAIVLTADVPTLSHLLAPPYSTPVVVLVPCAVLVGMLVQRHIDRRVRAEYERDKMAAENERVLQEQASLREVNIELADKVSASKTTLSALYRYARKLNVRDSRSIYEGLTEMLVEVIDAEMVSVWLAESRGLRLEVRTIGANPPPDLVVDDTIAAFFGSDEVVAIHDLPEELRTPNLPYLLGRIRRGHDGAVIAYLTVDRLPFSRYSPQTHRLFAMAVDWASRSLDMAAEAGPAPASTSNRSERPSSSIAVSGTAKARSSGRSLGALIDEADQFLGEGMDSVDQPLGKLLSEINVYLSQEAKE